MLEELLIRDVGVIRDVCVRPGTGFTVVTGETGAGKTMVVSALELLLGARADGTRVRAGAARALVEGRFAPLPDGAREWVDQADEDLVVSREVAASEEGARSRARIGGRLAPISALAGVLAPLVEVHGQGDAHRLADAAAQRELLDRFGGAPLLACRRRYADVYRRWRATTAELEDIQHSGRERLRETERLTAELGEIDAVAPVAGEEAELAGLLRRLEHAEALLEAARGAATVILDEGGARDGLGAALAALRGAADVDEHLTELAERVGALAAETQDVALELTHYADSLDLDPARLDELRARQAALRGLTRKYGEDAAAVLVYADEARERLAQLDGGDQRAAALAEEVQRLRGELDEAGAELRAAREHAGRRLSGAVEGHLGELAMPGARFEVEVADAPPAPTGGDRVTFLLAANPGEASLPLARAASGGERSRVALALRLSLATADDAQVLVFDEVDAGVGGEVALAVGEKLARLARGRQVLCVTHLAQVAAYADHHLVVSKRTRAGRTSADVVVVRDDERVRELSRLLSGSPRSDTAAIHAEELLADARRRLGTGAGSDVRAANG